MNTIKRTYKNYKPLREGIKRYQLKNPTYRLFYTAKQRALKQNIEFSIEISDLSIPDTCAYLNIPLTNMLGEGRVFSNASLDRIDSTKGYIKGNIQIISDLANRMKSNATPEQLIKFAKGILKIHNV